MPTLHADDRVISWAHLPIQDGQDVWMRIGRAPYKTHATGWDGPVAVRTVTRSGRVIVYAWQRWYSEPGAQHGVHGI